MSYVMFYYGQMSTTWKFTGTVDATNNTEILVLHLIFLEIISDRLTKYTPSVLHFVPRTPEGSTICLNSQW